MAWQESSDDLQGEALLPLPAARAQIAPATAFRSTWIVSSLESLRGAGHFDRYLIALRAIDRERRFDGEQQLLTCVAGSWLPIDIAQAHYMACQTLGLSEDQVHQMIVGGAGSQVRRNWHAQFLGAASRPGATPWSILPQLHKLWLRGANGGATAVYRRSENEAEILYVGCRLFDVGYFRHVTRAMLFAIGERFCQRLKVTTQPQQEPSQGSFLMRWE